MSTRPFEGGAHITRYEMYRRLDEHRRDWPREARALCVSGSAPLARRFGLADDQLESGDYPDLDLRALPYDDDTFDALFADQVLEHVEATPDVAVRESFRVVKPGGLVVHTTCFINPRHGHPSDFWRFTPEALRLLAAPYASELVVDGWGNRYVWYADDLGLRYQPIPESPLHPLHKLATLDDKDWPVVTWFIARVA